MGLGCSKRQQAEGEGEGRGPTIVRLSPFRPRRCTSLRRGSPLPEGASAGGAAGPASLLALAADALAASLGAQAPGSLARLPADLCQVLLDCLVASGALDDGAVAALSRACGGSSPLHVFRLRLGAYPEVVRPPWLALLASPCLEAADLSKTGVSMRHLLQPGCMRHLLAAWLGLGGWACARTPALCPLPRT